MKMIGSGVAALYHGKRENTGTGGFGVVGSFWLAIVGVWVKECGMDEPPEKRPALATAIGCAGGIDVCWILFRPLAFQDRVAPLVFLGVAYICEWLLRREARKPCAIR